MLSAVVLTHNDEVILERSLKSLLWCDEIVVVDDFSQDNTVKVAQRFKAKLFQRHLARDFAAQRNFALEKARGEWVFFVDSDEVVTSGLANEIKQTLRAPGKVAGFFIKRRDFIFGQWLKYGETGKTVLLRLAKKASGEWKRPVHEVWEIRGETAQLKEPLLHYPHPNVAQFIEEINYYSTLNADFLHHQGVKVSWWQIVVYPVAKFWLDYIWYLGFLDGTAGAVVAILMSFHSFLTRAKLYSLWQNRRVPS